MEIFEFIRMQDTSTSNKILKDRDALLKTLNPTVKRASNGFTVLDCTNSVDSIVQRYLPSTVYSVPSCDCINIDSDVKGYVYLPINEIHLTRYGMKNLGKCISLSFLTKKKCPDCDEKRKIEFVSYAMMNVQQEDGKRITIDDIQLKIQISNVSFSFAAIVEYVPPGSIDGIGHFVSHVLRKNMLWETYDDDCSKMGKIKKDKLFYPNHIIYVKDI